jgi:hypothetical protein
MGRKRAPPLPVKNSCEQVKSDVRFINSVTCQEGQHNSTEKAKSGGRYIFYVCKDLQFELHSAWKLWNLTGLLPREKSRLEQG